MAYKKQQELPQCAITTNCLLIEWKFKSINNAYEEIIQICNSLPRTQVLEQTDYYWHGVCRSLIFRFPDDLEILKISNRETIQIKSASRIGSSDLGVNRMRINSIYKELMKNNKNKPLLI